MFKNLIHCASLTKHSPLWMLVVLFAFFQAPNSSAQRVFEIRDRIELTEAHSSEQRECIHLYDNQSETIVVDYSFVPLISRWHDKQCKVNEQAILSDNQRYYDALLIRLLPFPITPDEEMLLTSLLG